MGIREKVGGQSPVVIGVFVTIALGVLAWTIWQAANQGPHANIPKVAYTTDDGKSFFYAVGDRVAPFDHDGKPAVIGHLYRIGEGEPFVGWLEKYTDASAPIMRRTMAAKPKSPESLMTSAEMGIVGKGRVYKLPGDGEWKTIGMMGTAPAEQEAMARVAKAKGQTPSACDP